MAFDFSNNRDEMNMMIQGYLSEVLDFLILKMINIVCPALQKFIPVVILPGQNF